MVSEGWRDWEACSLNISIGFFIVRKLSGLEFKFSQVSKRGRSGSAAGCRPLGSETGVEGFIF